MNIFPKRSTMVMLTAYMSLWLVIVMIAGNILDGYTNTINAALGLKGYRVETSNVEGMELEYFKSDYVQYQEDGVTPKTVTDENGYEHEVYDDIALRNDTIKKAYQVQREGTTILWNSDDSGLPLEKGDKVSLFSHSSVDWVYSGGGSGRADTSGSSNMSKALTNAGLEINTSLWNFYKSGEGKDYVRNNRTLVNEVPWSKYTSSVKNSFASYSDAAIIVLSRQGREGTGSTVHDLIMHGADTPSGDYLDLSNEERDMINQVVALKKAGTFSKVIVLLNTPTDLWLAPLLEIKDDIDCCMWVGQTGKVGLDEVGRILVGDSIPSGHLANTFLQNTRSNPASVTANLFTNSNSVGLQSVRFQGTYNVYLEGIYLGYKYYETRYEDAVMGKGNATSAAGATNSKSNWTYSEEVAFPFGYGGSYTTFDYSGYNVTENDKGDYVVTLTVKNVGTAKGADAVQIYVQKPYTDYDVLWGIGQSAVNLAGYAKTKELAPGESVDVSITVRGDVFKTYDAYNKKTYIREKGDYYIVAAQDAHDAVNNILASKGYTPENTNGVMDAAGNTSLVKKYSFTEDDFETFSMSDVTGNPITNQFDNADWNLYESRSADEKITYLSRNDWQATYPTGSLSLSITDKMLEDLAYNHEIVEDPNAKMPLYGQNHVFNLIDLKGYDYNHSAWDTLLDQLTFDEQVKLLSTAYHGTKAVTSIAKPADVTKDGPLGVRQKYKTNSSEYTMSFPSTTLLAASYNDELALEVGELMGEDMLHSGITGIYGTGANIHRTSYSSRNWEYYSEDGFLSGIMAKQQVIGIQSKGCYVNLKHFALNDQETSRHGVSTFANEQSIREIYLAAYEYAVTEGDCTGVMTAFNRVGTSWSGAHKGLCTEVLRNEWGFKGFVISDSRWEVYMGVIDGVLAGNDCLLDTIDASNYEAARTSPTAASAIREAVHRVLYVTVNSNAMNGLSPNTKIIQVKEWWQVLVEDVQNAIMIAVGVLLLLTILTLIFRRDSGLGEKNIIVTIISMVLAVAIAVLSIGVPVVLNGLPMNFMSEDQESDDDTTGGSTDDIIEDDRILSKFEAECAELTASNTKTKQGTEGKGAAATNNPSGGAFIHNLENSETFTVTFRIHSPEAKEAGLILCMGRRELELKVADMFTITVNGEALAINSDLGYSINTGTKYYDWSELEIATVNLKEGENVITLTRSKEDTKIMNLDYLGIKCDIALQPYVEFQNGGHAYSAWSMVKEPTLTTDGKISTYCDTCRDYVEEIIPAISEANGYTRTILSDGSSQFVRVKWTFTKDSSNFDFIKTEYPSDMKSYVFEAENGEMGGGAIKAVDAIYGSSGGFHVGKMNEANSYVTIDITAEKAGEALLIINFGRRTDMSIAFNNGKSITLNGDPVFVPDDVVFTQSLGGTHWYDWCEFDVVTLNLIEGRNTITLKNAAKAFGNVDYFKLISKSELSWYVEEEHEHKDTDNDHYCNVCAEEMTKCADGNGDTLCDVCGESVKPYISHKFEAEGAEIESDSDRTSVGTEGKGAAATNNPSGDAFIHNLENAENFTVTFKITSSKEQKAILVLCMGRREKVLKVADMFDIWVNDKLCPVSSDLSFGLFDEENGVKYYDWVELEVATIELKEGENVIAFTRNANEENVLNLDYILIKCQDTVEDTREKNNGHSYEYHVITAPTYTAAGTAGGYCEYCRDYKTLELPAVSTENGYTKLCDGAYSLWKYSYGEGESINVSVTENVAKETYNFNISADSNPFAGEFGSTVATGVNSTFKFVNNQYYEKTYGVTFKTKVTVTERTVVTFYVKIRGAAGFPATGDQLFPSIKVNGRTDGVAVASIPCGTIDWYTTVDCYAATIILEAGTNEIEFTRDGSNINILGVAFESTVPVTLGGTSKN